MARDLLGATGDQARQARLGKWLAGLVLFAMVPLALERDLSLWRLIELKMELLIQCAPAFLLSLHWTRQTALATLLGLLAGTSFAVGLTLGGVSLVSGVHVGVLGFCLNLVVVFLVSLWPGPSRSVVRI